MGGPSCPGMTRPDSIPDEARGSHSRPVLPDALLRGIREALDRGVS